MSHYPNDKELERIVEGVYELVDLHILNIKDSLLTDLIDNIAANYHFYGDEYSTEDLIIKFLSSKCVDAMSSKDLEDMAGFYKEKSEWNIHHL